MIEKTLSVLVVDDSAYARRTLSKMVDGMRDAEAIGSAPDGVAALREIKRLSPDLVLLDLEMPELDGFGVLRALAEMEAPPAVLVISAAAEARNVLKALELGALDFVAKPTAEASPELQQLQAELERKIGAVRSGVRVRMPEPRENTQTHSASLRVSPSEAPFAQQIVVIGASTGGPGTLLEIVRELPPSFPGAIVIAQHMPAGFTAAFAERLRRRGHLAAAEATEGMPLRRASIVVAPGGSHVTIGRDGEGVVRCALVPAAAEPWVPSVDRLFVSAASLGADALGVVLTGMGSDGAAGALALRSAGAAVIAESNETAIVEGMPSSVVRAGAASLVRRREEIAVELRAWAARC